jgi:hypothetical protein
MNFIPEIWKSTEDWPLGLVHAVCYLVDLISTDLIFMLAVTALVKSNVSTVR